MRYWRFVIVIMALGAVSLSCVPRTSVYQTWASQLRELPFNGGRVDDVSLLLGTPPDRCEPVENPRLSIGAYFDLRREEPIVRTVIMNSPAYQAGIRGGDIIKRVGGQPVVNAKQAGLVFQDTVREGQPIEIETSRGTVSVIAKIPKTEQCYWEIHAGQVARTGSSAFVNRYAGSSSSGGAAYERFFRASCRVQDGLVVGCQENWQQ
jgi:membrane-associated protease RseP (regulator of RpoE activity)